MASHGLPVSKWANHRQSWKALTDRLGLDSVAVRLLTLSPESWFGSLSSTLQQFYSLSPFQKALRPSRGQK